VSHGACHTRDRGVMSHPSVTRGEEVVVSDAAERQRRSRARRKAEAEEAARAAQREEAARPKTEAEEQQIRDFYGYDKNEKRSQAERRAAADRMIAKSRAEHPPRGS
jgi:hypothetical protein